MMVKDVYTDMAEFLIPFRLDDIDKLKLALNLIPEFIQKELGIDETGLINLIRNKKFDILEPVIDKFNHTGIDIPILFQELSERVRYADVVITFPWLHFIALSGLEITESWLYVYNRYFKLTAALLHPFDIIIEKHPIYRVVFESSAEKYLDIINAELESANIQIQTDLNRLLNSTLVKNVKTKIDNRNPIVHSTKISANALIEIADKYSTQFGKLSLKLENLRHCNETSILETREACKVLSEEFRQARDKAKIIINKLIN